MDVKELHDKHRTEYAIHYMLGAKLTHNDCPSYMIWKFPDEAKILDKLSLPIDELENITNLSSPTWKKIKFSEDYNLLMLAIKCAKHIVKKMVSLKQNEGTKAIDLVESLKHDPFHLIISAEIDLDFALRSIDKQQIYQALHRFAVVYNDNKEKIYNS